MGNTGLEGEQQQQQQQQQQKCSKCLKNKNSSTCLSRDQSTINECYFEHWQSKNQEDIISDKCLQDWPVPYIKIYFLQS